MRTNEGKLGRGGDKTCKRQKDEDTRGWWGVRWVGGHVHIGSAWEGDGNGVSEEETDRERGGTVKGGPFVTDVSPWPRSYTILPPEMGLSAYHGS